MARELVYNLSMIALVFLTFFINAALAFAEGPPRTEAVESKDSRVWNYPEPGWESKAPNCADLSDSLCDTLWDSKNKGNLKVADGEIRLGQSTKSDVSQINIDDLQTYVANANKLPADLRKRISPALLDLKKALATERHGKAWSRELSRAVEGVEAVADSLVYARVEAAHPELKKKSKEDLTVQEQSYYVAARSELDDILLDTRYGQSSQWKMAQSVFEEARKDLIAEANDLPIPEKEKKERIETLRNMTLTLPYSDKNKIYSVSSSCRSTEINARYDFASNKFTICAGMLNAYRSPMALYRVIAHEIGHSNDMQMIAYRIASQVPSMQKLNKLVYSKSAPYSCKEWEKIKMELFQDAANAHIYPSTFGTNSFSDLADCLADKTKLAPFLPKTVVQASYENAKTEVAALAAGNAFVSLAQSTIKKFSTEVPNELYRRPDLLTARLLEGNQFVTKGQRDANFLEIFNQELKCSEESLNASSAPSSRPRAEVFEQALNETEKIGGAQISIRAQACGDNCPILTGRFLAVDTNEGLADWWSNHAVARKLARESDLSKRQILATLSTITTCEEPSATATAPDLAFVEKQRSGEMHPENRSRRLSLFNDKVAHLVQCKITRQEQGFGGFEYGAKCPTASNMPPVKGPSTNEASKKERE